VTQDAQRLERRATTATFATLCVALFMANLDNTAVNVALPMIQRSLSASVSGLQWVVAAYTLVFATLMLSAGRAGDLFGRRRVFLAGLATFTAASLACALSTTLGLLIAFRAIQGAGAAMLLPTSLAIITHTYPDPVKRARAIGAWAGIAGVALGLGPVLGGVLTDAAGWEWVFVINVPIGAAALVLGARHIRESRDPAPRSIDAPGQLLAVVCVGTLTYALIDGHNQGWGSAPIVALFAVAACALAAFLVVERRSASPMLDLTTFRRPAFRVGNIVVLTVGFGLFGMFFFLSLFLQQVQGLTPIGAALRILPMSLCVMVAAPVAGQIAARRGSTLPVVAGLTLSAIGMLAFLAIGARSPYIAYVWSLLAIGTGIGMTLAPNATSVMGAVPPERAGMAAATLNMSRELGGNLGIAVLGAILVSRFSSLLGDRLHQLGVGGAAEGRIVTAATHGHLTDSLQAGGRGAVTAIRTVAGDAFVGGLHAAMVIAAVALLAAAAAVARSARGAVPSRELAARPADA
jgi:EmrB/QacA subfamily drug resistance transporter